MAKGVYTWFKGDSFCGRIDGSANGSFHYCNGEICEMFENCIVYHFRNGEKLRVVLPTTEETILENHGSENRCLKMQTIPTAFLLTSIHTFVWVPLNHQMELTSQ